MHMVWQRCCLYDCHFFHLTYLADGFAYLFPQIPKHDLSPILAYEKETGIDLIHNTIQELSAEMAQIMKIDQGLKRMDSMMVASNIKRMGRLELLYTCVSNLAKEAKKAGMELPENLLHYTEDDGRNKVITITAAKKHKIKSLQSWGMLPH